jgi:hypothetical protein
LVNIFCQYGLYHYQVTIAVGGFYHAQVIHFAIAIEVEVRECRIGVIEHLLELLQVFGLTKQGSYSLQIQVLGNIGSGGGDSHGLVCHGYVWSQEEPTKNQGK